MHTVIRWIILGLVLSSICSTGAVQGQEKRIVLVDFGTTQPLVPPGWELVVTKGTPRLELIREGAGQALRLQSTNASFALQCKVNVDLSETPYLVWEWKVTQLPTGGDFRRRRTDDQAAQLIVAFSPWHFITYIWDSTVPQGTVGKAPAPPFRKIRALVVRSGSQELGTWLTERRNLVEDYKRLFGKTPKTIRGIRIQINSQHTRSRAEALWRSIMLVGGAASWPIARETRPPELAIAASPPREGR